MLGISIKSLRNHVHASRIRFVLVGARRKFTEGDVQEFIQRCREAVPASDASKTTHRVSRRTSSTPVYDFTTARAERIRARRKKS